MKAVITGATGAIGVALIKKLIEENVEILVIARKDSKRNDNIPKNPLVKVLYASLCDLKNLESENKYTTFYHLAWDGTVGLDRDNLTKQYENVLYAMEAVDLAKRLGCDSFIGVGSQAEYGRKSEALSPTTNTTPESGYGVAKLCASQMTALKAQSLGLRQVWVRVLSVYGPFDGGQSLVMSTIDKSIRGEKILCTKGEQIWDYLYSGDAAEALYLLGKQKKANGIYVLGSGEGRPLANYIKDICSVVKTKSKIEFGAVPYSEKQVMFLKADITKLQKDTGWYPKKNFCDGIKEIIKNK